MSFLSKGEVLSERQSFPGFGELPAFAHEVILARSSKSKRPPCDFLAEKIMSELRR